MHNQSQQQQYMNMVDQGYYINSPDMMYAQQTPGLANPGACQPARPQRSAVPGSKPTAEVLWQQQHHSNEQWRLVSYAIKSTDATTNDNYATESQLWRYDGCKYDTPLRSILKIYNKLQAAVRTLNDSKTD